MLASAAMDRFAGHTPVLRDEVAELLSPAAGERIVDCTVGLGGHAADLLSRGGPDLRLIGIDRDEANLARAKQRLAPFAPRVRLFHADFADVAQVLEQAEANAADVLLADLGVASTQLDDPGRGFSFAADGPLDMRMDTGRGRTAADLVNELRETDLADLIYRYGQERYSRRIARAIVHARRGRRVERTGMLAEIVVGALPAPVRRRRRGVHPATRTFQALRIAVNDELGSLERLLAALPDVLATGARAAVIGFHSLEDRPVKRAFRAWAAEQRAEVLTRKPITASEAESRRNPRSRSAKLRGIRWIG